MDFLLARALASVVCSNSYRETCRHALVGLVLAACTHTCVSACSRWTQRASAAWQGNDSDFAVYGGCVVLHVPSHDFSVKPLNSL